MAHEQATEAFRDRKGSYARTGSPRISRQDRRHCDDPLILGSDLAVEVVKVGAEVTRLQAGDRVLACVETGAFQQYCIARIELVAKLPEHISYAQGSVLGFGTSTAACTMFQPDTMALDLPKLEPRPNNKIVLK